MRTSHESMAHDEGRRILTVTDAVRLTDPRRFLLSPLGPFLVQQAVTLAVFRCSRVLLNA